MDCAHSFFPNAQLEMNHQSVKKKKKKSGIVTFCHLGFIYSFFSYLLSPTLSLLLLTCLPSLSIYGLFSLFFVSSGCFFFLFFLSLSLLFHLVNSISRGPRGAEKIEPQIEQSISVRIHQCQTTPSLLLSVPKHAHARAVIFD